MEKGIILGNLEFYNFGNSFGFEDDKATDKNVLDLTCSLNDLY